MIRELKAHGIMWGAFRDKSGTHMNAHANNLVVVNEIDYFLNKRNSTTSSGSFLAPIDFDMAYTRDSCVFGEYQALSLP